MPPRCTHAHLAPGSRQHIAPNRTCSFLCPVSRRCNIIRSIGASTKGLMYFGDHRISRKIFSILSGLSLPAFSVISVMV